MSALAYALGYWLMLALTFVWCQAFFGPWNGWESVKDAFRWPVIVWKGISEVLRP